MKVSCKQAPRHLNSAQFFMPSLKGEPPTVDLVVGYHKASTLPILKMFLSGIDDLTTRIPARLAE